MERGRQRERQINRERNAPTVADMRTAVTAVWSPSWCLLDGDLEPCKFCGNVGTPGGTACDDCFEYFRAGFGYLTVTVPVPAATNQQK
jgi:hypothetical protein